MGIKGYILKDDTAEILIEALDEIHEGKVYISPGIRNYMDTGFTVHSNNTSLPAGPSLDNLTNRETEILKLVAEGHSNAEIAAMLGISELTVKTHRYHMMEKLGLHKLADLVLFAVKNGIVES